MLSQMAVFHLFLWLSNTPLFMYTTSLYNPLSKDTFVVLHILATMNNVGMNIGVHIKFSLYLEFSCVPGYSPISICKGTSSSGWVFLLMLPAHTVFPWTLFLSILEPLLPVSRMII